MGSGFVVEAELAQPPGEVWDYLTDFTNAPEWMTGVHSMAPVPRPLGVGTRLRFSSRNRIRESEVAEFDEGRKIALKSTQGGITALYRYEIEPVGSGSRIRLQATCSAMGLWKWLHPFIVRAMERSDSNHLARLAAALDSNRSPAGDSARSR